MDDQKDQVWEASQSQSVHGPHGTENQHSQGAPPLLEQNVTVQSMEIKFRQCEIQ